MARLMLVDDDDLLSELLQISLEVEGHEVTLAADGAKAIAVLKAGGPPYDLVLLDLMMPGMDGLRFLRSLAGEMADLPPIVVLSAVDTPEIRNELLSAGVRAVMRKPVEPADILVVIDKVIAGPA